MYLDTMAEVSNTCITDHFASVENLSTYCQIGSSQNIDSYSHGCIHINIHIGRTRYVALALLDSVDVQFQCGSIVHPRGVVPQIVVHLK